MLYYQNIILKKRKKQYDSHFSQFKTQNSVFEFFPGWEEFLEILSDHPVVGLVSKLKFCGQAGGFQYLEWAFPVDYSGNIVFEKSNTIFSLNCIIV